MIYPQLRGVLASSHAVAYVNYTWVAQLMGLDSLPYIIRRGQGWIVSVQSRENKAQAIIEERFLAQVATRMSSPSVLHAPGTQ